MQHNPMVAVEDAINACKLIVEFTSGMKEAEYCIDLKTKAAVEREFEIIGEAINDPDASNRVACATKTSFTLHPSLVCPSGY